MLLVQPGESWKREDVGAAHRATAERFGTPRAAETDGAVELRDPVETPGTPEKTPLAIRDPKHFLANQPEALLARDPRWEAFTKQLGGMRSALQQTELAPFVPPGLKVKARFMNLAPTLRWASTMRWHLKHPESKSRRGIAPERMRDKLGWLEAFAADIGRWRECQAVIAATLTFLNTQGLFRGVSEQLRRIAAGVATGATGRELAERTVKFVAGHEEKLAAGERLPTGTEIVESAFGRFNQLEGRQSRGGFTHLLPTFPVLLRPTTPEEALASFGRVKVRDVRDWEKKNQPQTLTARRRMLFREANPRAKRQAKSSATPTEQAA